MIRVLAIRAQSRTPHNRTIRHQKPKVLHTHRKITVCAWGRIRHVGFCTWSGAGASLVAPKKNTENQLGAHSLEKQAEIVDFVYHATGNREHIPNSPHPLGSPDTMTKSIIPSTPTMHISANTHPIRRYRARNPH